MDPRTKHMLTAAPLPLLARMATPSTLAFFVQGIVSLAEVWFIGQLGSISLAAGDGLSLNRGSGGSVSISAGRGRGITAGGGAGSGR